MIRGYLGLIFVMCCSLCSMGNNVKVSNLSWPKIGIPDDDCLALTCEVEWENSWRDAYNYDAVWLFFKIKKKDEAEALKSAEKWEHLYLIDRPCELREGEAASSMYDYWFSPLGGEGNNCNVGVFLFRKQNGSGNNAMKVTVYWDINGQKRAFTREDIENDRILISAHALEMVYVPGGAFRVGDGISDSTFKVTYSPIPAAYDLVDSSFNILASNGSTTPKLAADRLNENTAQAWSAWVGGSDAKPWWVIDFGPGNEKELLYWGINAASNSGVPEKLCLQAETVNGNSNWYNICQVSGKDYLRKAQDAYPVERAIPVNTSGKHQRYRIVLENMQGGVPVITSISMTDRDLSQINDYSVLIDGKTVQQDTLFGLGAKDGAVWNKTLPATYPNGFRNFYAMKYEITQEQYVGFLNKLSFKQQNNILNSRLTTMQEGEYIFGQGAAPSWRNGIVLATRISGMPAIFAHNLNPADSIGRESDGREIACNYMSVVDLLAYADWAGLRPLTELEYEKMSRPLYPYHPKPGEYAWNTTEISPATGELSDAGTARERPARGNANYGNAQDGPLRAGAFATAHSSRPEAGAGYWGGMELCGNLSEIYFNANNPAAITLIWPETTSGANHMTAHGDGYVSTEGYYDGAVGAGKKWSENVSDFALRGGSFFSPAGKLTVSDRSGARGKISDINARDSSVSFRLGRSLPERTPLVSSLILENGAATEGTKNILDTVSCNRASYYIIRGNDPVGDREVHTFIWKMQVSGGRWQVIDGECGKDLIFRGFKQNIAIDQIYRFKRIVTTPTRDSEASSAFYAEVRFNGVN